jgi:hypothetical protein
MSLVLVVLSWYPSPNRTRLRGPLETFLLGSLTPSDIFFWAISRFLPDVATRTLLGTPPGVVAAATADEQARVARMLRDILPLGPRQGGLSPEAQLTVEPLSMPLESISVPTLLYGTCENTRLIARRVPNARFFGYPSGGHLLVGA